MYNVISSDSIVKFVNTEFKKSSLYHEMDIFFMIRSIIKVTMT